MRLFSALDTKYSNYITQVSSYLSSKIMGWRGNLGSNTVFGQIITVVGNVITNAMLYIEDSLTEQNKFTAQRKKSIYGLAVQSGYQPSTGSAASVLLSFTIIPNNLGSDLNIVIPNHSKLTCTQNGLVYSLVLPQENITVNLGSSLLSHHFSAVQGIFKTSTYTSTGGKYYTQNVNPSGYIDMGYITVKVNGEEWEQVVSLYDMGSEENQYCIKISYSGGIDIIFGNGKYGKEIEDGDSISVTYLSHDGENGNIDPNTETYFVFSDSLQDISGEDIDGNSVFNITFSDRDSISSGSNSESVEQVQMMIGYNSRSLVLASSENYKYLISRYSFVGYNRTWSETGSLIVNTLALKNYASLLEDGLDYFSLSESDFLLTDSQKESIYTSIQNSGSQLAGSVYQIIDPELWKYALFLYITLKDTASSNDEYIKNQVRTLIGEFFMNIENDQYIPKSDIIYYLKENVDEIDGINAYFLSEKNETAKQVGYYTTTSYTWNLSTQTYDTSEETVTLYGDDDPNLGLDEHGNISLSSDRTFPILMGGWDWLNSENQEVYVSDPLTIIIS